VPFGSAAVVFQLLDYDDGDERWLGDWWATWEYLAQRLLRFEFIDSEKKKDEVTLTFQNTDLKMLDAPVFAPGQKLAISWGWPGQLCPPRRMVITQVKAGDPFVVVGHCMLQLLDKEKRSGRWENATASEVVREIAEGYGYAGTYLLLDDTEERGTFVQAYQTDARFLAKLARQHGREFYIDAAGLHWARRATDREPVRVLHYRTDPERGSILDPPQFEIDLSKPTGKVRVVARHPVTKAIVEATAGPTNDDSVANLGREDLVGDPDGDPGLRGGRLARTDVRAASFMTQEQAQRLAWAHYYARIKGRYKLTLPSVIGDSRVGAKNLIGVYGMSETADGLYYLTEVRDTIESGRFVQSYQCEKDSLRRAAAAKKTDTTKPNPKADDPASPPPSPELTHKVTTMIDDNGEIVAAYAFVDQNGEAVGGIRQITPEELAELDDVSVLSSMGATSGAPDDGQ
jgi:phage protein D